MTTIEPIEWPGAPATADERAIVAAQLGRDPRGDVAVSGRCSYGLPAVVRTEPRLDDGSPFPTLFYLTCPVAIRAIGTLEATGRMRELQDLLERDPVLGDSYADADRRYRARRDSLEPLGDDMQSAGGMPTRVKCLHALYAHEIADGNPIGALVRAEVEPLECPAPCVVEQDGAVARAEGHPGFKGKKRRR